MRIIKFLLGLAILAGLAGCASSNAQLSNSNPTPQPDREMPVASDFYYPIGKSGGRMTEPKDRKDDWYNARDFGEADHLGEDWNKNSGGNTDCGEPVHAVAAGRIVYAENGGPGWGNVVIIEHVLKDGTKFQSLYGHLLKIEKTTGDVASREKIGEVGNAEGRYFCHLHLEIREANCPMWGQPGPGYANDRTGWTDPSDFIDRKSSNGIVSHYDPLIKLSDLETDNKIGDFARHDFSSVWPESRELLGFYGENFQRLRFRILSVKKDLRTQSYFVRGESILNDDIRPVNGAFKITEVRRLKVLHWGVDDEYRDRGIRSEGILIGEYELSDSVKRSDSGRFLGQFSALWFIDRTGKLQFDDIQRSSDPFRNNQFIGFWTPDSGSERVKSNWGDFRIPDSGDLDIGAAEFVPNDKYLKNGWQSYRDNLTVGKD